MKKAEKALIKEFAESVTLTHLTGVLTVEAAQTEHGKRVLATAVYRI